MADNLNQTSPPPEISHLVTAFLPSCPQDDRSKAYATLASFCRGVRSSKGKQPESATETLVKAFEPLIVSRLAGTDENELLASVSFLTAIFRVDREPAAAVFGQDGVVEGIIDNVDLNPTGQLAQQVAQLLSQASGYKAARMMFTPQSLQWLNFASSNTLNTTLRTAAMAALIKFSKGSTFDRSEVLGDTNQKGNCNFTRTNEADFATALQEVIISGADEVTTSDALEGLAYLSVDSAIKEALSYNAIFIERLLALVPRRRATSPKGPSVEASPILAYGVIIIISNICAYRRRLTEEEGNIQKLRQMANARKTSDVFEDSTSDLDDDETVRTRIRRLVEAGVLDIFPAAMRVDSDGIRLSSGKTLLNIIEDQRNRGKALQSGCAKVLTTLIKHAIRKSGSLNNLDPFWLHTIQALAKLAITASPIQVFGPNEGAIFDAIDPFSFMLQGPSSNLLQRFESMMALTNLASHSIEVASRIAKSDGLVSRLELLLLEEHALVRRAAMELLCNLIAGSDHVFERYGGREGAEMNNVKSKLQVLLALCDVDDLATRLAASGALATLTNASSACQVLCVLQAEKHRAFQILARLVDSSVADPGAADESNTVDAGLRHRAIVCARNIFVNISISDQSFLQEMIKEATKSKLLHTLGKFVRNDDGSGSEVVLRLAVEALEAMTAK